MLQLRTLGGLYVAEDGGEPLGGAASQRRLLALLAAVAVAGERGVSRDKLAALLWPDSDEERAKHSLTQALYAARRALGVEDLFAGGGDVRLRRDRCGSDVQDFEEALEAGDLSRAVALYGGPFVDGFFLPGSGEFEQWCSRERSRLEDRAVWALDRLAAEADAAGRARDAVVWRKRLVAIRPLDTAATVALMRTLAQTGDRAGALQHAQVHQTMLREQLSLAPDPVVASLAERLREPTSWSRETEGAPAGEGGPPAGATAMTTERPSSPPPERSAAPVRSPWLGRRWAGLATAAAAVGLIAALWSSWRPAGSPASAAEPVLQIDQKVVVAPFRVTGADENLAYLREGLVELLSTRLADDSSARSVDAGAVLSAWRAAGSGLSGDVPRATVTRLAGSLGAERVVVGSVVGTRSRLVISAAVVDVASGLATGQAVVEGAADSITTLVDRLAGRLLLLGAGEEAFLAARTTGSLGALRAFLDGQAAFRRGSYDVALLRYQRAVRLDSSFALAAVQLARSADRLRMVDPRARALALAWRERDALDARARALVVALAGPAFPAPSRSEEQVGAWERLVELTPDRADSWYEAGLRFALEGRVAGEADAHGRALFALQRAVRLEADHAPARQLLALLGPDSSVSRAGAADTGAAALLPRWRAALAAGDASELRRLRATVPRLNAQELRVVIGASLEAAAGVSEARLAIEQLRARTSQLDDRVDVALAEHALALNQGRRRVALAAGDRLGQLRPGAQPHLRLRVLDALYGDGDSVVAEQAARVLGRFATVGSDSPAPNRGVRAANACVLAQWRLQQGDTAGVSDLIAALGRVPLSEMYVAPEVSTPPWACGELLSAVLAVAVGRADAAERVARLDSLALTAAVAGDGLAYVPILIARLHHRLGDTGAARAALQRRADLLGWPRYLTTVWREEARYAVAAGDSSAARDALRRYLALRGGADSDLQSEVEQARRALAGLAP